MRFLIQPGSSYDETEETASEVRLGGVSDDPGFFFRSSGGFVWRQGCSCG